MTIEQIINIAVTALSVIFHIVTMVLCAKGYHVYCQHDSNTYSEVDDMKSKTANYREKNGVVKQSFDKLIPQYSLNTRTNELVETPDKLDIQELINSNLESCLERVLMRLMPQQVDDGSVALLDDLEDDLDVMNEAFTAAEEWREKLGLSETLDTAAVFGELEKYSNTLKAQLNKNKEVKPNVETQKEKSTPDDQARQ